MSLFHLISSSPSRRPLNLLASLPSHLGFSDPTLVSLFVLIQFTNSELVLVWREVTIYVLYAVGWGSFHLGFSNNADPEPGRCRRTDGKKWRCSRDAVADQKYCERHINRGRHRSRKPVEGQTGHAVAGASVATTTTAATSSSSVATMPSVGGASNSLAIAHNRQQMQSLDIGASNSSAATAHMSRWSKFELHGPHFPYLYSINSFPGLHSFHLIS